MSVFGGIGVGFGDLALFAFTVAVDRVDPRLHPDQIDDAAKILIVAQRKLDRHCITTETLVNALLGPVKACTVPIDFIDYNRAWKPELLRIVPHLLGLR